MEDRRPTGPLGPGTRVEVRSGYGTSWARGFEVAGVDGDGAQYLVRRVSDGQVLPASPMQAFASGQFNQEPVLQGSNHDEYRLFVATQFDLAGHPLTAAQYLFAIAAFPTIG